MGNCDRDLSKAGKQVSCHPHFGASLLAGVRKTGTVLRLRYPDDSHIKYVTFSRKPSFHGEWGLTFFLKPHSVELGLLWNVVAVAPTAGWGHLPRGCPSSMSRVGEGLR